MASLPSTDSESFSELSDSDDSSSYASLDEGRTSGFVPDGLPPSPPADRLSCSPGPVQKAQKPRSTTDPAAEWLRKVNIAGEQRRRSLKLQKSQLPPLEDLQPSDDDGWSGSGGSLSDDDGGNGNDLNEKDGVSKSRVQSQPSLLASTKTVAGRKMSAAALNVLSPSSPDVTPHAESPISHRSHSTPAPHAESPISARSHSTPDDAVGSPPRDIPIMAPPRTRKSTGTAPPRVRKGTSSSSVHDSAPRSRIFKSGSSSTFSISSKDSERSSVGSDGVKGLSRKVRASTAGTTPSTRSLGEPPVTQKKFASRFTTAVFWGGADPPRSADASDVLTQSARGGEPVMMRTSSDNPGIVALRTSETPSDSVLLVGELHRSPIGINDPEVPHLDISLHTRVFTLPPPGDVTHYGDTMGESFPSSDANNERVEDADGNSEAKSEAERFRSVDQVELGAQHMCVMSDDGEVFVAGVNKHGQLGLGEELLGERGRAKKLSLVRSFGTARVATIACGGAHSLFATVEGRLFACGDNREGQCGSLPSEHAMFAEPTLVKALQGSVVRKLAAGSKHSCCLVGRRTLFEWGQVAAMSSNSSVQGTISQPQRVCFDSVVTDIILAQASPESASRRILHSASAPAAVSQISCGRGFSSCLTECGEVFVWGQFFAKSGPSPPEHAGSCSRYSVRSISAGSSHVVCVTDMGGVLVVSRDRSTQKRTAIPAQKLVKGTLTTDVDLGAMQEHRQFVCLAGCALAESRCAALMLDHFAFHKRSRSKELGDNPSFTQIFGGPLRAQKAVLKLVCRVVEIQRSIVRCFYAICAGYADPLQRRLEAMLMLDAEVYHNAAKPGDDAGNDVLASTADLEFGTLPDESEDSVRSSRMRNVSVDRFQAVAVRAAKTATGTESNTRGSVNSVSPEDADNAPTLLELGSTTPYDALCAASGAFILSSDQAILFRNAERLRAVHARFLRDLDDLLRRFGTGTSAEHESAEELLDRFCALFKRHLENLNNDLVNYARGQAAANALLRSLLREPVAGKKTSAQIDAYGLVLRRWHEQVSGTLWRDTGAFKPECEADVEFRQPKGTDSSTPVARKKRRTSSAASRSSSSLALPLESLLAEPCEHPSAYHRVLSKFLKPTRKIADEEADSRVVQVRNALQLAGSLKASTKRAHHGGKIAYRDLATSKTLSLVATLYPFQVLESREFLQVLRAFIVRCGGIAGFANVDDDLGVSVATHLASTIGSGGDDGLQMELPAVLDGASVESELVSACSHAAQAAQFISKSPDFSRNLQSFVAQYRETFVLPIRKLSNDLARSIEDIASGMNDTDDACLALGRQLVEYRTGVVPEFCHAISVRAQKQHSKNVMNGFLESICLAADSAFGVALRRDREKSDDTSAVQGKKPELLETPSAAMAMLHATPGASAHVQAVARAEHLLVQHGATLRAEISKLEDMRVSVAERRKLAIVNALGGFSSSWSHFVKVSEEPDATTPSTKEEMARILQESRASLTAIVGVYNNAEWLESIFESICKAVPPELFGSDESATTVSNVSAGFNATTFDAFVRLIRDRIALAALQQQHARNGQSSGDNVDAFTSFLAANIDPPRVPVSPGARGPDEARSVAIAPEDCANAPLLLGILMGTSPDASDIHDLVCKWVRTSGRWRTVIRLLVAAEVSETRSAATLFRGASGATRLMVAFNRSDEEYASWRDNALFGTSLSRLRKAATSKNATFEMDPERNSKMEKELGIATEAAVDLLESITAALHGAVAPRAVADVVAALREETTARFGASAGLAAASGYIVLRSIAPRLLKLVDGLELGDKETPAPGVQKLSILLSKVVQSVSLDLEFNEKKDKNLLSLNTVVKDFSPALRDAFLVLGARGSPARPLEDAPKRTQTEAECAAKLYQHVATNLPDVVRGIAVYGGPSALETIVELSSALACSRPHQKEPVPAVTAFEFLRSVDP